MEAAVADVEEAIEECADTDLSALDQYRGRVCPANRRFYFTLTEGLPALLAAERAKQQQPSDRTAESCVPLSSC